MPSTQLSHSLAKACAPYTSSMGCLILALHLETSRTSDKHVPQSRVREKTVLGTQSLLKWEYCTVVELEVDLRNEGVGPPNNRFVDPIRVPGCCDQSCDSSVAPTQQREPAEAQSLKKESPIELKTNVHLKKKTLREASTHRHQVHNILRVPLKEVRAEVSIRRAGSPVTAGVPSDHREEFLIQRLQLRTKIRLCASCGGKQTASKDGFIPR